MTDDITGNATENGAEQIPQGSPQGSPQEKTVPYSRFQEMNTAKKLAEAALEAVVKEMEQDVPEAMRDLIPASLPAAERAAWIRNAKARGLFTPPASPSSPDAKRPGGKPTINISDLLPMQKMRAGYKSDL